MIPASYKPKKKFMQLAIAEAKRARDRGDYPIGAVITRLTGRREVVIASAGNRVKTSGSSIKHVELETLGLVYLCVIVPLEHGGNRVHIKMSMTAPGCGMGNVLKADVESKLSRLPSVKEVHVEVVFDPPWHPGLMSEAAKLQLGFDLDYGVAQTSPPIHGGR
jgi:metal-sulfur cluster biosynthetic enzyme